MYKPTLGYPSRTDAISALVDAGLSIEEVHERVGGSFASVRVLSYARQRRAMDRKIVVPWPVRHSLAAPAAVRGITVGELIVQLLEVVIRDDVVGVLLGAPGETDA